MMDITTPESYQRPPCGPDDPPLPFALGTYMTNMISSETYRLLQPLGNGSYAIVYLVDESPSGCRYALKCLSKQNLTSDQLVIQRNEIHLHVRLPEHKNLVKLHTAFENEDWWFLVLEYVPGSDLYWWITQKRDLDHPITGKRLNERERLELISAVFTQCLEAVRVVHSTGMSHRDLKPENFLITSSPTEKGGVLVKLTDFGLATTDKHSTDFDCGSKPYMSYECRNPLAPIYEPCEADVWSLGIILLNLIWHRSPWSDPCLDECESFRAFCRDKVGFLMRRFEGMPRPLAAFLASRVFGRVEDRVQVHDWQVWCNQLVDIMMLSIDAVITPVETQPLPTKKTFGFNITMTSFFPLLSPSTEKTPEIKPERKVPTPSIDFSAEDEEEMDFSQPIVFDDGISVRVHSQDSSKVVDLQDEDSILPLETTVVDHHHETTAVVQEEKESRRSDNDSGFATDEFRSSFDIPVTTKPVTGIAKYIPPKLRFTKNSASSNSSVSASPIPIPINNHRGRRFQASKDRKDSFDDTVGSMPSSFGGHGINVGGFAYQSRPFAPIVPLHHHNSAAIGRVSGGVKKSSRDFFADRERDMDDWRQHSPVNRHSGHPVDSPPKYSKYSSSPLAQPEFQQQSQPQHNKQQQQQQQNKLSPVRIGHRKRSSTVSAADPVKLFNGPMPGMTNFQYVNRSMVSLNSSTAEKSRPFSLNLTPPTPTDDPARNLALAETGLRAEVLSPAFSDSDQDDLIFQPDDEPWQDSLKVVPKNTMTELGRLLKSIVGYNRSVKVGGEGKD